MQINYSTKPLVRKRANFYRLTFSVISLVILTCASPSQARNQQLAIVKRGDTIATIAQRYRVTPEKLIRFNNIKPPYEIYIGQPLKIPQHLTDSKPKPAPLIRIFKPLAKPDIKQPLPATVKPLASPLPQDLKPPLIMLPRRKPNLTKSKTPLPPSLAAQQYQEIPAPISRQSSSKEQTFLWPLKGKILAKFGTESNRKYNRGINISADSGALVAACESGIVAYAGNEIKGFGNMILIKHANGWMSAYAHNRQLLVSRGDKVLRGQKIAEVGATGNVEQPQLHFELRKKTRAVDPQKYLVY